MAGHARYTAILDACVLYPISIADALLSMAVAGLYAAKWTTTVEDEWVRNLEAQRPELTDKLAFRREAMRRAIPDWEVPKISWESLVPVMGLPDAGDNHVLAAAIAGHADCIVTANLKDFPDGVLEKYGMCAIHPDDFLIAQFDLDPIKALAAFKEMRGRSRKPPFTPEEFADVLERNGLAAISARLRDAVDLI